MQVGTRTAETLQGQGEQMGRVLDTLHEIQFSMKKAGQVIRDITRGIATDKCDNACISPCTRPACMPAGPDRRAVHQIQQPGALGGKLPPKCFV